MNIVIAALAVNMSQERISSLTNSCVRSNRRVALVAALKDEVVVPKFVRCTVMPTNLIKAHGRGFNVVQEFCAEEGSVD